MILHQASILLFQPRDKPAGGFVSEGFASMGASSSSSLLMLISLLLSKSSSSSKLVCDLSATRNKPASGFASELIASVGAPSSSSWLGSSPIILIILCILLNLATRPFFDLSSFPLILETNKTLDLPQNYLLHHHLLDSVLRPSSTAHPICDKNSNWWLVWWIACCSNRLVFPWTWGEERGAEARNQLKNKTTRRRERRKRMKKRKEKEEEQWLVAGRTLFKPPRVSMNFKRKENEREREEERWKEGRKEGLMDRLVFPWTWGEEREAEPKIPTSIQSGCSWAILVEARKEWWMNGWADECIDGGGAGGKEEKWGENLTNSVRFFNRSAKCRAKNAHEHTKRLFRSNIRRRAARKLSAPGPSRDGHLTLMRLHLPYMHANTARKGRTR